MGTEVEAVLRLLLATALGAIIGYQRERANKPAGLRTHILICVGAALFTVGSSGWDWVSGCRCYYAQW